MAVLAGAYATPGTTIVTTAETLVVNVPAQSVAEAPAAGGQVVIRGNVQIATGASVTGLVVRLRIGPNNTTTALVDTAEAESAGASGAFSAPFEFVDPAGQLNLSQGYSITIVQTAATGNGTVTAVDYEVDVIIP